MSNRIVCPKCGNNANRGVLSKIEGEGKHQTITLAMAPCGCDVVVKDDISLEKTQNLFDECDKAKA